MSGPLFLPLPGALSQHGVLAVLLPGNMDPARVRDCCGGQCSSSIRSKPLSTLSSTDLPRWMPMLALDEYHFWIIHLKFGIASSLSRSSSSLPSSSTSWLRAVGGLGDVTRKVKFINSVHYQLSRYSRNPEHHVAGAHELGVGRRPSNHCEHTLLLCRYTKN
eukprot:1008455-Amorphochlora_amoeboformis.AAC.2